MSVRGTTGATLAMEKAKMIAITFTLMLLPANTRKSCSDILLKAASTSTGSLKPTVLRTPGLLLLLPLLVVVELELELCSGK